MFLDTSRYLSAKAPDLLAKPPMLPPSTGTALNYDRGGAYSFRPDVRNAITANMLDRVTMPVAPTATPDPNVGQPGSANNAGNINGAAGNIGYAVETIKNWRAANPGASTLLKIALPVAGVFLFTKGHPIAGVAVAGASIPLWMT